MARRPTKTVRDIFLEAISLTNAQRDAGLPLDPAAIGQKLQAIGKEAGYRVHDFTLGGNVTVGFIGRGWWTGATWDWKLGR
jgi:hypothetical protein